MAQTEAASQGPSSDDGEQLALLGDPLYFPCNREDALMLLAGLYVGPAPMDDAAGISVAGSEIALLPDGVRLSEMELLRRGDAQRFVLLLDVGAAKAAGQKHFTTGDIRCLIFRSEQDAQAFRLRPVEEFDTRALPYRVDAALFDLPGPPRIQLSRDPDPQGMVYLADRLAAGVAFVIILADGQARCRAPALHFLGADHGDTPNGDLTFQAACEELLLPAGSPGTSPERSLVLHGFRRASAGAGIGDLVAGLERQASGPGVVGDARVITSWIRVARDVLQNRIELAGEQLSDDRSLVLRGALLALSCDRPEVVSAFLDSDRPPGPRVAVIAAFLAGLRQGVRSLPWEIKRSALRWLPALLEKLAGGLSSAPRRAGTLLRITSDGEHTDRKCIAAGGLALVCWDVPAAPAVPVSGVAGELRAAGYEVAGAGRLPGAVLTKIGHKGLEVEVSGRPDEGIRVLRHYPGEARKQRKKKEIAAAFAAGGMFWYPGTLESGQLYLSCDVQHWPSPEQLEFLSSRLDCALDALLVPAKAQRPSKRAAAGQRRKAGPKGTPAAQGS